MPAACCAWCSSAPGTCAGAGTPRLARERWAEYASAATREARFARLCDKLHMGVVLVALARSGQRGLSDFVSTLAQLDCSEFAPCAELLAAILAESRALLRAGP